MLLKYLYFYNPIFKKFKLIVRLVTIIYFLFIQIFILLIHQKDPNLPNYDFHKFQKSIQFNLYQTLSFIL